LALEMAYFLSDYPDEEGMPHMRQEERGTPDR
jgi:hypothetical protein